MNGVCWPLATSVIWDDPSPGLERPPGGNGCTRIGARDLFLLVVFFCLLQPWRLSPGEERGSHPQLRGQRPGNKWTAGSPWPWVSSSCASPLAVWSLSSILLFEWPGASGAKRAVDQPVASLLFWPRMKKKEKAKLCTWKQQTGKGQQQADAGGYLCQPPPPVRTLVGPPDQTKVWPVPAERPGGGRC